jgi:hypothetical protein
MSEIDYYSGRDAYALKTKEGMFVSYDPSAGGYEAYSIVDKVSELRFWDIFTESFAKRARYIQDYAKAGWKVKKLDCEERQQAAEIAAWVCFGCTDCKRKEVESAEA